MRADSAVTRWAAPVPGPEPKHLNRTRAQTPPPLADAKAGKKQDTAQSASHYGESAGLTANKHGQRQAALLQADVV